MISGVLSADVFTKQEQQMILLQTHLWNSLSRRIGPMSRTRRVQVIASQCPVVELKTYFPMLFQSITFLNTKKARESWVCVAF